MSESVTFTLRFEPETFAVLEREASRRHRDKGDYCMALIEKGLIDSGAFDKKPTERDRLRDREELVDRVRRHALDILATEGMCEEITIDAVRRCEAEPDWMETYRRFVAPADPFAKAVAIKRRINPRFGLAVKAATGADAVTTGHGRSAVAQTKNSVIQSATRLRK